jgi:hypothetical protein
MQIRVLLILLAVLALNGCFTERVPPVVEYPAVPDQSFFLVKKIVYEEHGRPLFNDRLRRRPGSAGAAFTVVHAVKNRPVRSYDIAIVGSKADLTRPFAVIYEWTGRGYEGGVEIASGIFPQGTITSGRDAAVYLAVKTAPVVIATVTGFVVGVLASIPETAATLGHVVVNARETITGRAEYLYDEQNRIRFMKLYPPASHADALVTTEYRYEGSADAPVKTIVTSVAEKKVRTIP